MNSHLKDFILEHGDDDPSFLMLSRHKWPGIDMPLAASCIAARKKLKDKLPSWCAHPDIIYPDSLSPQQCSSEETARYKAELAERICGKGSRIADLTGGLGVDSFMFSGIASNVLYNEMNPQLANAAGHNFSVLGAENVTVRNTCLQTGNLSSVLDGFSPDLIYLDPARRSSAGRKVFMLADCSPDILTLKEELLEACHHILVKLSPMADISLICKQLGSCCREVHVTGSEGECKELLVWMDRNWEGPYTTVCGSMSFTVDEEKRAVPVLSDIEGYRLLYEPGKALMKSACFNLISSRFSLGKMAASTHLYLSDRTIPEELACMGKVFEILQVMPFNKQNIKALAAKYPDADITSRNLPVSSDELRKKMHGAGRSAVPVHIFAAATVQGNLFFVTQRIR